MSSSDTPSLFANTRAGYVIAATCAVLVVMLFLIYQGSSRGFEHTTSQIESTVQKAQSGLLKELGAIKGLDTEESFQYFEENAIRLKKKGVSLFVFETDELVSWSTNAVPNASLLPDYFGSGPCVLLPNGWYLMEREQIGTKDIYALFLVKYEYHYENRYLINRYHTCFQLSESPQIQFTEGPDAQLIKDIRGQELFYVAPDQDESAGRGIGGLVLILLLCFIYLAVKFLFQRFYTRSDSFLSLVAGIFTVILIRLLSLWTGISSLLDTMVIFDPLLYHSSWLYPSLGDLVINAFTLLMLGYALKEWMLRSKVDMTRPGLLLLLLLYFMLARSLDDLFKGVIQDAQISFEISNFFALDIYSFIAISGILALALALFFLARAIQIQVDRMIWSRGRQLLWLLVIGVAVVAVNHFFGVVDLIKVLWPWTLLFYLFLTVRIRIHGPRLVYLLGVMVMLAMYTTHVIEKHVLKKDREELALIADRLMEGEDRVAEMLFDDMKNRMLGDSVLWSLIQEKPLNEERLLTQFKQDYFNGYWAKYEIDIERVEGASLAEGTYAALSDSMGLGFNRISQEEIGLNYVLKAERDSLESVYLLFKLNIIPEELGFPELLIEGGPSMTYDLSRYSFAQYHQRELVDSYGDFDYRLLWSKEKDGVSRYFQEGGYWHFPFDRGQDTFIISTPRKSFMDRLTTFTYLFCFLGLMIALAYLIERILIEKRWPRFDLQYKVQLLVVSILFTSLFVFGLGAYYYILSQHKTSNEGILSEKVSSVLIELSHKLEKENAMGDQQKLELYLDKFAKVFFTDINLYDLEGTLMASSRPQVFSRGLIAQQMDPAAYSALKYDVESRYIHEEDIGGLRYLSAYVPFMDSKKEVLAYLNLPYFAKQTELEDELSRFLVTVINVLVLLFVVSILVAVLISNWITLPLQMLKENLAAIRLDQTNKPIDYSGSDEIANLVAEYNTKVEELQRNAELLAKSERESAWREMAKQVAHEIKNPLTPMKLSIQYLQRSQADGGEDWEERFKRSTNMLIEQIDTLSAIATAFSDFAQMPKAINERFDLVTLVEQVVDLFQEEPEVDIYLRNAIGKEAMVIADKDQVMRMLTNLVKNAIQSIPDEQEGRVEIELMAKGYQYILEVRDNGTGIPEEMQDKIFVPNFTTKTTGTGLGLAMCKNIIEQAGGQIWFKTELGSGTSFFVSIPMDESS